MKIWTKVKLKDKNKEIEKISRSLTNYLYAYGPISEIISKYNISEKEYKKISQYTANRISGILMLYLTKDIKRINDIANKYNLTNNLINEITPEIEGYINKEKTNYII